ncbi:MAG: hypothetical protein SVU88_03445 [Candidatus Nanohaloarchaea archaeon]|nr:hypothetical protein [Candidatus Nanohaloarchaea archaeon]
MSPPKRCPDPVTKDFADAMRNLRSGIDLVETNAKNIDDMEPGELEDFARTAADLEKAADKLEWAILKRYAERADECGHPYIDEGRCMICGRKVVKLNPHPDEDPEIDDPTWDEYALNYGRFAEEFYDAAE